MQKKLLDQTHASYDADRWAQLEALAKGGKQFHSLIDTFLPRNPMEPDQLYCMRKANAKYYSYTGSIINLYVSWMFAAGYDAKAYVRDTNEAVSEPDRFYSRFQEDVGGETTLKAFMKERFRDAMTSGHAIWLAQLPQAGEGVDPSKMSKAEYEDFGLGNASLTRIDPACLLDWAEDDHGNLRWAIVKSVWDERLSWRSARDWRVEQWRIYEETEVTTFELRWKISEGRPHHDVLATNLGTTVHGFRRVPLVRICMPDEMCIGEQTMDAQVGHFQQDNALSWAMKMACYPMPVFHLADGEKPPVMGVGYAIMLGEKESLTYASPPTDSFDAIAKNRDSKRDEIFRIVHQMAQGLDNNAETVGRSADSKEIDAAATRIMLNAYGEIVGKAIEETFELVSEARGDTGYEWSIKGFSGYDTATASSLLANIIAAKSIGIPSPTFMREISKKGALSLVPELDPKVKDTIRAEIDKHDFAADSVTLEEKLLAQQIASDEKMKSADIKSRETVAKQKPKSDLSKAPKA